MTATACHADAKPPRELAKDLILNVLGVRAVAGWCNVSEAAVYQWMSRGTDRRPIPTDRAISIINGARASGVLFDPRVLGPELPSGADAA